VIDNNKVEVNLPDIGKITKPMTKLIDAVSDAIGNAFDPEKIKARAEARGVALVTKTKAEIHSMELRERAQERVRLKEERRQENIESITAKAMLALPDQVGEKKPDEDWVHQFFEHAQDVGDKDMQTIWSKLLAGEVSEPGTYSLLTMSTLKILGKYEADLFTKYYRLLWVSRGSFYPLLASFTATWALPWMRGFERSWI